MNIHWLPLLGGLIFGLLPPSLLIRCKCRYVEYRSFCQHLAADHDSAHADHRWWRLPLIWLDPLRGFVTALFLSQALSATPDSTRIDQLAILAVTGGLLLLVLWIQAQRRERVTKSDQTVSPTAFLAGMIVGFLPPMVAIAAVVLGVTAAMALTTFAAGYVAASLTTLTIGFIFSRNIPYVALSSLIVAFPMLVSWFRRTTLVMLVRA